MFSIRAIVGNYYKGLCNGVTKIKAHVAGNAVTNTVMNLILIAILVPIALGYIFAANTDGWDSTTVTLFKLIGTMAVIGFALAAVKMATAKGK